MREYRRLLKYVTFDTMSSETSETAPTTAHQFDLARELVDEMKAMGIEDARVDDCCYVYGSIPASSGCEDAPAIGLISHMDTVPDFSGAHVNPRIIENYDGRDIPLGSSGRTIEVRQFPVLADMKGRTLIVTDGTTVLGADDKAGIAEILTAAEKILQENIPHGRICIAFTPDEEVGHGTDHFDLQAFGADFAYTVDGNAEGEVVYENFNAAGAEVTIRGVNVHPGAAKDIMVNAVLTAMEFNSLLPGAEVPSCTEGREGFFHLLSMQGTVEQAKMQYIIRDHSRALFEHRKEEMAMAAQVLNDRYGEGTVQLVMHDQYYNMVEKIKPHFHLIENACAAVRDAGLTPKTFPVRGGTDGAMLSFRGLPCPNLGTGGYACHGPYEFISAEGMDKSVEIILGILRRYAKRKRES